jgi:putative redox protein
MTSEIIYKGQIRTEAKHIYSGTIIETDGPLDNHGLAQRFSPTDLVATALGSCMLSIMGIAGNTHGINIDGTKVFVEKIMASEPRRIGQIKVDFEFPTQNKYTDKEKIILERAALNCPVHKSLHPDLVQSVEFNW